MSKTTSGKEKWHPQDLYLFLREEILSQRLEPGASLFERMILSLIHISEPTRRS
mgnify:CR=1 FL=1